MPNQPVLRFSHFEIRTDEHRLLAHGCPVPLGSRAFDVLKALAQRPGQLVTKDQLLEIAWPGENVLENNLATQISTLRKVLGPNVIATVSGRGYRFVAKIAAEDTGRHPDSANIAAASAPEQRTNLPRHLPAMLGRGADLDALQELIAEYRVVSVVGPGGMGKSLLARHVLANRRNAYPHGVCWVEMSAVSDAAALPSTLAGALGLPVRGDDALTDLVRALAPLQLLLALDNAEHLLEDVALIVQAVHDAAPGVSILVTSQAPMRVPDERTLRLAPLAVPDEVLPAAEARLFGAVALFEERARAADRQFVLTNANAAASIALCRALDGLPLAIELAAARLPVLGLQGLTATLHERLHVFTANANRWAPARQQTLRAMIEWSHSLLDERERIVFRRLGLVVGSASLAFIQGTVADEGDGDGDGVMLNKWAVLDALQILVDRSLVTTTRHRNLDEQPRYGLLQSTRAYALEMLAAADELQVTSRRYCQALADQFTKAWCQRWDGSLGTDDWVRQIEPDLDNAREAQAQAMARSDVAAVLAIGTCLMYALPSSNYAERLAVGETCHALLTADHVVPDELRLHALLALGALWIDVHWQRSRAPIEQALRLARIHSGSGGDTFWLYFALSLSAASAARQGDLLATQTEIAEMRVLENPGWPPQRLGIGVSTEALVAFILWRPSDVLVHVRRQLTLRRAAGARDHVSLNNLISAEVAAGEARAALKTGAALLSQLQGTRDEYGMAYARLNMTAACLVLGDTGQARVLARRGLAQAHRFSHWPAWADYLALLAAMEGRHQVAARIVGFSNRCYEEKQSGRFGNEARAFERAREMACDALGSSAFDALQEEGRSLRPDDIAKMALDSHHRGEPAGDAEA